MEIEKESCPVCWRNFSIDLRPYSIPCGHSYCFECSENQTNCPLCRKRLPKNYSHVMNYSLLSLIERHDAFKAPEKVNREVQTDEGQVSQQLNDRGIFHTIRKQPRAATRKQSHNMKFKFERDTTGNIQAIQFSLI